MLIFTLTACLLVAAPPDFRCEDYFDCPSDDACDDGICVPRECDFGLDGECPLGTTCEDRLCILGCFSDQECPNDRVCGDVGGDTRQCVECVYDFQCPQNGTCRPNHTCQ